MAEDKKNENIAAEGKKSMRILELIIMVIFGFFALISLILYGYHFFI